MVTAHVTVLAKEEDFGGYWILVFKDLDNKQFGKQYIMCVVCPNWQTRIPDIGERGYLNYETVVAGEDKYWDGNQFIPYRYTNIYFIKFIKEVDNSKKDIIL